MLGRSEPEPPLPDRVTVRRGDRHDRSTVEAARDADEPDVVIELPAPRSTAEDAVAVFADADGYLYVSGASAHLLPHGLASDETDPLVAGRGEPGEAHDVAEQDTAWLDRRIAVTADALGKR